MYSIVLDNYHKKDTGLASRIVLDKSITLLTALILAERYKESLLFSQEFNQEIYVVHDTLIDIFNDNLGPSYEDRLTYELLYSYFNIYLEDFVCYVNNKVYRNFK